MGTGYGNGIPGKPISHSSFSIQALHPLGIPGSVWKDLPEDMLVQLLNLWSQNVLT